MENRQENVPIENNNNVCCSMNEDDSLDGYDDNGNGQYAAELPPEVRMLGLLCWTVTYRLDQFGYPLRRYKNLYGLFLP